jgi:hypothetical protein
MWQKYKIGESLKINDPETKAPAVKNPFYKAAPRLALWRRVGAGRKADRAAGAGT